MASMRICHVITGLRTGGAEMMLLKLATELRKRGAQQLIVSLADEGTIGPRLQAMGLEVICGRMRPPIPSWPAYRKLRRVIRQFQPDVVQGWMYHGNSASILLAPAGVPRVWGIRQSLYDVRKEKIATRLVIQSGRLLSRYCDRIVYNSATSACQHERFGYPKAKRLVIGNGFGLESFRPDATERRTVRSSLGVGEAQVVIGHVARYHPMKNHAGLVRAFALATKNRGEAQLVMAGAGVDSANGELTAAVREAGLASRVHLLGGDENITTLMKAFDIYASSSLWGEGFPNVLGEAMATAVPCVTTDVGDCADIVGNTGWVVPAGDSGALSDALAGALDASPSERAARGERARKRIEAQFSIAVIADHYEALYAGLVTGSPPTAELDATRR